MNNFGRPKLLHSFLWLMLLGCTVSLADTSWPAAEELYKASQWQQAAVAFDTLASNETVGGTKHMTALLYAGESLVQLKDYSAARQRFEAVRRQTPPDSLGAHALFRLGEVAWLSGEHDEARTLLQSYVENHPQRAFVNYARDYLQQVETQQASQADYTALDEAVAWQRQGKFDAAIAAFHDLLQQPLSPTMHAEALRRSAQLHERLGYTREALAQCREYLAKYPHARQAEEVMSSVAWLLVRLDQTTQAAEQFRAVYAKFPQSAQAAEAAYWLAQQCVDEQESEQANHYVDELLSRTDLPTERPSLWSKTLCMKCQLLAQQQQWQAIDELVEQTQIDIPDSAELTKLLYWAAEALFRLHQYDQARTRFETLQPKTLAINEPWIAMVPLRRAQLAARRQQWGEVLNLLDQLERDFPNFELYYEVDYLRGRALAGRGAMSAARKHYDHVIQNQRAAGTETAAMAGWMIGETYFHQRNYHHARLAYAKTMQQESWPQWQARAALQVGKCWELEQNWYEAAKIYSTALGDWPASDSQPELETRLRWAQQQTTEKR